MAGWLQAALKAVIPHVGDILSAAKPAQLAGHAVAKIVPLDTKDGVKFFVDDGSWLLVRLSGTEPLVRVYAETRAKDEIGPMLDAGERMVRGGQ